jgi:hypothetical protein
MSSNEKREVSFWEEDGGAAEQQEQQQDGDVPMAGLEKAARGPTSLERDVRTAELAGDASLREPTKEQFNTIVWAGTLKFTPAALEQRKVTDAIELSALNKHLQAELCTNVEDLLGKAGASFDLVKSIVVHVAHNIPGVEFRAELPTIPLTSRERTPGATHVSLKLDAKGNGKLTRLIPQLAVEYAQAFPGHTAESINKTIAAPVHVDNSPWLRVQVQPVMSPVYPQYNNLVVSKNAELLTKAGELDAVDHLADVRTEPAKYNAAVQQLAASPELAALAELLDASVDTDKLGQLVGNAALVREAAAAAIRDHEDFLAYGNATGPDFRVVLRAVPETLLNGETGLADVVPVLLTSRLEEAFKATDEYTKLASQKGGSKLAADALANAKKTSRYVISARIEMEYLKFVPQHKN